MSSYGKIGKKKKEKKKLGLGRGGQKKNRDRIHALSSLCIVVFCVMLFFWCHLF